MCDYSLHAVESRPAQVGEKLVSAGFRNSSTRGFVGQDNPRVAVCLRPGTELAFESEVQREAMIFHRKVGDRLARFRQINPDKPYQHHDALEFSNGTIVLVTDLAAGQKATVLQLPATPAENRAIQPAVDPSARDEIAVTH